MKLLMNCRVLVVDDEPIIRSLMSHTLSHAGATVDTAVDGLDALRKLEQSVPDVLLSDLKMPNMDGLALIHHVRERYPFTVPIVLTASMERKDAIAAIKEGVFDFVEKSGTDMSGTELAVRRAADWARMLRERHELLGELQRKNVQLETGLEKLQTAYAGLREQAAQIQRDLTRAQQIQRRMLPAEFPPIGPYDFSAYYRPCDRLGGDFFGRIPLSGNRVALYLADVSGHGVAAAMVTVELREMIRAHRRREDADALFADPSATLQFLNGALWEEFSAAAIHVTMFYGVLDVANHRLAYASAGHPGPFVEMAGTDGVLPRVSGMGLALRPEAGFDAGVLDLLPGARVLIYSDGLLDPPGIDGNGLTRKALGSCFEPGGDAGDLADRVITRFTDHLGGQVLPDDVSLLALHRGALDARPSSRPTVFFAPALPVTAPRVPPPSESKLTRAEAGPAVVLRLSGHITWREGKALHDQINKETRSPARRVILDLSQCNSLDSTMLGLLCRLPAAVEVAGLHGQAEVQVRELGVWELLRYGDLPDGEPVFTAVRAASGTTVDQAQLLLESHEALAAISEVNRERFAGVIDTLRDEKGQGGRT